MDNHNGAPISSDIVFASSSERFSYSAIMFSNNVILSSFDEKLKVLNACFAAATATSMSSFVPAETEPITDSLDGLITSIVSDPNESTHAPLM